MSVRVGADTQNRWEIGDGQHLTGVSYLPRNPALESDRLIGSWRAQTTHIVKGGLVHMGWIEETENLC